MEGHAFNTPPGWPKPPSGWVPPDGWKPDQRWPAAPPDWVFWTPLNGGDDGLWTTTQPTTSSATPPPPPRPTSDLAPLPPPVATAGPVASSALPAFEEPTANDEVRDLRTEIANLQSQLRDLKEQSASTGVVELDDERVLQEVGIYRYHHPLENSEEFRDRLRDLQEQTKQFVLDGEAILKSDMFTFNNSLAKGRKMTSDFSKLMLRAYNAEADS